MPAAADVRPATPAAADPRLEVERASRRRLLGVDAWILAVAGVTAIGLGLRVTGIDFGLPYQYHWDEPTLMNRVIRMGGGDLNPHYFYYPSLLMYITLVLQGAHYVAGHPLGAYGGVSAFGAAYFENPTPFYLIGRVLVAVMGSATIPLLYVLGRRLFSPAAGLLAAGLLAVSPIHVSQSHFFTTDVPMALAAVVASIFISDVYRSGRRRDYVAAGVAIGLGISVKYLPVLFLVSLVLAHALRRRRFGRPLLRQGGWRLPALGAGTSLLAFAATSPFAVLDWRSAVSNYTALAAQKNATGCVGDACQLNFIPYVTQTLPWSVGAVAYAAAILGLLALALPGIRRRGELAVVACFPVLYFVVVGLGKQPPARYLVPLAPFVALSAAPVLLFAVRRVAGARLRVAEGAASTAVTALFAVAALAPPLFDSISFDDYTVRQDARSRAAAWFDANVPDSATVSVQPLVDRYFQTAPILTESRLANLETYIPAGKPAVRAAVDAYFRARHVHADAPFAYDVATLRREGVRYVVLSSAHYHNVDPAVEDPFYADLSRQGRVVARFAPLVSVRDAQFYPVVMPTITIYELPPA